MAETTMGYVREQSQYALRMFAPGSTLHGLYGYMLGHYIEQSGCSVREKQALLEEINELQLEEVNLLVEKAIAEAVEVRAHAQARYSNFRVGATLLSAQGKIVKGVNVECSSYGLTLCAERGALAAACAQGIEEIVAVVVCTDTEKPVSPCGACRQLLMDYAPDAIVIMHTVSGVSEVLPLHRLLPRAFGHDDLG